MRGWISPELKEYDGIECMEIKKMLRDNKMLGHPSSSGDNTISIQIKSLDVRLTVFVCTAHPKKIY